MNGMEWLVGVAANSTFKFLHFLKVDELTLAEVGRASVLKAGGNVAREVTMSNDTAVILHFFSLHLRELLLVDWQLVKEGFRECTPEQKC